jgi:hypothetical protein
MLVLIPHRLPLHPLLSYITSQPTLSPRSYLSYHTTRISLPSSYPCTTQLAFLPILILVRTTPPHPSSTVLYTLTLVLHHPPNILIPVPQHLPLLYSLLILYHTTHDSSTRSSKHYAPPPIQYTINLETHHLLLPYTLTHRIHRVLTLSAF